MNNKKITVLFSGGLDSTVALASAVVGYGPAAVNAVVVDYGQKHRRELVSAMRILQHLDVAGDIAVVPGILKSSSPLLDHSKVQEYSEEGGVSDAFIPGRNFFFLAIAANRAVLLGSNCIYVGANADDQDGFPDCRPIFFTYATQLLQRALNDDTFSVHAPLITFNKKEIVETALRIQEHNVDVMGAIALSHTCYRGESPPCGACSACVTRARGFLDAGIPDPLLTRLAERNSPEPGRDELDAMLNDLASTAEVDADD